MRTLLMLAGFMASLVAMAQSKVERPAPLERSVSSSQQFIIYHSDRALRSRLARRAEDLKEQWLRRLRLGTEWKSPIIIQVLALRRRESPRIRTGLYESDGGELKVQIDVLDSATLGSADFDREVYRALFLEYAYRNVPPKAGKAFHQPPAWLIEGIHEDVVARQEGVATGLYESLIKEESPPKLEAFLKERPEMLDATSRAIYRARCLGLFRALLRAPRWTKTPRRVLREPPAGQSGRWRQTAREVSRPFRATCHTFEAVDAVSCGRLRIRSCHVHERW